MGFTVEQDCPQCGGPIELDETDHLLRCPYCHVKNYLFTPKYFRYLLPLKAPHKEIIYAPYLRFKGNVFYCTGSTVGHRVVDITHVGLPLGGIPASLGLRPQTMKMKFGHHGANHPVQDLENNRVMISSQNHGFAVDEESLLDALQASIE